MQVFTLPEAADADLSYEERLLNGLAIDLATYGFGVWRDDVVYGPDDLAIAQWELPPAPDRILSIAPYLEEEVATYRRDQETVGKAIQLRLRLPNRDDGSSLQGRIRDRYHRRRVLLLPDTPNALSVTGRQTSAGYIGEDDNRRYLFSQNITFTGLRARSVPEPVAE